MSRRHRLKRLRAKQETLDDFRKRLTEKLLAAAKQHMGADYTPEMEEFWRAELRKP